jgi:hypothetical protein
MLLKTWAVLIVTCSIPMAPATTPKASAIVASAMACFERGQSAWRAMRLYKYSLEAVGRVDGRGARDEEQKRGGFLLLACWKRICAKYGQHLRTHAFIQSGQATRSASPSTSFWPRIHGLTAAPPPRTGASKCCIVSETDMSVGLSLTQTIQGAPWPL